MQKKAQGAVIALFMASLLAAPLAEAKRVGGGKSMGMKRSQTSSQNYSQNNYNNTAPSQAPAQAQPQRSGSNVGGMVAAGVAGAALGAVAGNAMADNHNQPVSQADAQQAAQQEKKSGINWLWLIVLAAAGFFIFRRFTAKKQTAGANPYAPNNGRANDRNQAPAAPFGQAPTARSNTNIFGQAVGNQAQAAPAGNFGAYTNSGNQLLDGSEPASFLRFARQRFNHVQAMNNPSNIAEIKKYFTDEMYQSIYADVANNADVAEFSNLAANIVDQANENGQYVVSVQFTGTVSEDLNSLPQPFTEVWHFVKAQNSQDDWLVAGIQQA